jgi:hypothetical protein
MNQPAHLFGDHRLAAPSKSAASVRKRSASAPPGAACRSLLKRRHRRCRVTHDR